MSANSYSALIRRSKLSSYNASIEQVYTTPSAHLARSNFGLKRPLPSATTRISPFVRVTSLDNEGRRTDFRKGTKEALYVRKWEESGVGIRSVEENKSRTGGGMSDYTAGTVLQSRFVPAGLEGGQIKSVEELKAAAKAGSKTPLNLFDMEDEEFERFLNQAGDRREEFVLFLQEERAKYSVEHDGLDLFSHAQGKSSELISLLNRFLSKPAFTPTTLIPEPHSTLGLQYSTPTPLESSLAPPIPGRILGQRSNGNARESHSFRKNPPLSMVLGQVSSQYDTGTASSTTFFPDATGYRSNIPGRATFSLNPEMRPLEFAMSVNAADRRGRGRYNAPIVAPDWVPKVFNQGLMDRALLEIRPEVVNESSRGPLPGTQEYSMKVERPSPSSSSYLPHPTGFTSLIGRGSGRIPRDLGSHGRTKSENYAFRKTQDSLERDRRQDASWAGVKRQGGGTKGKKGNHEKSETQIANLLLSLQSAGKKQ